MSAHSSLPSRRGFLAAAGALAAVAPAPLDAAALPLLGGTAATHPARVRRALVLSGGGARGAYQAGIIDYLRLSRQIPDGAPLAPYGIVAGTSIGALNAYFVATGQYSLLRSLWYSIADQHVIKLKPKYAKVARPDSGVGTRLTAALRLALSLATDDTGVIDGDHLRRWLARYVNPSQAVVMPVVWTVTNLTTQSSEFFYLVNTTLTAQERELAVTAIRLTVGPTAVLREATPELLLDALRASTAIPVAFDPVELPAPGGDGMNQYVDGGVTANTPVGVARAAAKRIDVVLLDPPLQKTTLYKDALEVGFGVFGAMQRRILEADLRAAYLETYAQRATHLTTLFDTDIFQLQPTRELPVGVVGFDDRENLYRTFKAGFDDARTGFVPYVYGSE